jgi:hypothetical protein
MRIDERAHHGAEIVLRRDLNTGACGIPAASSNGQDMPRAIRFRAGRLTRCPHTH